MESRITVVVLDVWVDLVLFEKNRSELVVAPVCGFVQRAPATALLKSVDISFGSKAPDLVQIITKAISASLRRDR